MATTEERLVHLEANVEQHSTAIVELKGLIVALDQKIDRRFDAFEQRFDRRFDEIGPRFEDVGRRFDQIDRRFLWVIGIQFSIFLTVFAGMFGIVAILVRQ